MFMLLSVYVYVRLCVFMFVRFFFLPNETLKFGQ